MFLMCDCYLELEQATAHQDANSVLSYLASYKKKNIYIYIYIF